jgi:hypothetical protein
MIKPMLQLFIWIFCLIVIVAKKDEFLFSSRIQKISNTLREGTSHRKKPPIVLLPGLASSRMVAWKKKKCLGADIEIQSIVWLNLKKLMETMLYEKDCWLECLKLDKNSTDPSDCKVRPDEGLGAVSELSPGMLSTGLTSLFTPLIRMLAHEFGYDANAMVAAPYDWRLSPLELEVRDAFFSSLRMKIEVVVKKQGSPSIVIAHSMGNNIFLYFCDWMKMQLSGSSISYREWMATHVYSYVGYSAPLLGTPSALKSVVSGHAFGLPIGDLQVRDLLLTFPSTHFLNPRSTNDYQKQKRKKGYHYIPLQYDQPIFLLRNLNPQSDEASVYSVNLEHVENGSFFQTIGEIYREPRIIEKLHSLQQLYHQDPLQPLSRLYERPPIKHVIMLYGVDLPTDVGYIYQLPPPTSNETSLGAQEPLIPVLEEVLIEETIAQHRVSLLPEVESPRPISSVGESIDESDEDGGAKNKFDLDKTIDQAAGLLRMIFNMDLFKDRKPQFDQEADYEDESNVEGGGVENDLQDDGSYGEDGIVEVLEKREATDQDLTLSSYRQKMYSRSFNFNLIQKSQEDRNQLCPLIANSYSEELKENEVCPRRHLQTPTVEELGIPKQQSFEGSTQEVFSIDNPPFPDLSDSSTDEFHAVDEEENNPSLLHVRHQSISPSKAGIFVSRPNYPKNPFPFSFNARHFLQEIEEYDHSGDMTVPYVSLSFVKTWLTSGHESCPQDKSSSIGDDLENRNISHLFIPSSSTILTADYSPPADHPLLPLFEWSKAHNKTTFSSMELFHSQHLATEDETPSSTLVMEVSGAEHLQISKLTSLHYLLFEYLLPRMNDDLQFLESASPRPGY